MRQWLWVVAVWAVSLSPAARQDAPKKLCPAEGFGADPKVAEIATAKPAAGYYGCQPGHDCLSAKLAPGDPFLVWHVEGEWTCGYHSDRNGAAPMWVRSKDIRMLPVEANPQLDAWAGTWGGGENTITVERSKTPGKLDLEGHAVWHGINNVEHVGDFGATAAPNGNHLHVTDGPCQIDLTLIGRFLITDDNSACGGFNVHFSGIWNRSPEHGR